MRRYSPVIGLLAVITAMAILQLGTLNADASSATISSQSNQIRTSSIGDQGQMLPMYTRFARDAGDAKNADEDKKVGESEKKEQKPDLRIVDWSKVLSVKKDNGNGDDEEKEDEDKKDDEGGGFDRLWDVVTNG